MPLILHHLTPLHWAVAGAGIAAITLCLLFVANRRLGISTGLEDVCSLVVRLPYFTRDSVRSARKWRLPDSAARIWRRTLYGRSASNAWRRPWNPPGYAL